MNADSFRYEIRKDGKVFGSTNNPKLVYPEKVEGQLQEAGYGIYINGKRQSKRKTPKK